VQSELLCCYGDDEGARRRRPAERGQEEHLSSQRAYECVCLEQRHFIDLIALGFEAHVCCGIEFDQAGLHSCGRSSLFSLSLRRLMIIIAARNPRTLSDSPAPQHAEPNIGCPCIILLPVPSRQTSLRRPLQMHGALPCFGYTLMHRESAAAIAWSCAAYRPALD
jgi:hypothetical protein